METLQLLGVIEDWYGQRMEDLFAEAEIEAARFYDRCRRHANGQWSKVGPRVRRARGDRSPPGAFVIEWTQQRGARQTKGQGPRFYSTYIRRGAGDCYPVSAFRPLAQDWQLPLIEEAEEVFTRIRVLAKSAIQTRRRFREHEKLEARRRGGEADEAAA